MQLFETGPRFGITNPTVHDNLPDTLGADVRLWQPWYFRQAWLFWITLPHNCIDHKTHCTFIQWYHSMDHLLIGHCLQWSLATQCKRLATSHCETPHIWFRRELAQNNTLPCRPADGEDGVARHLIDWLEHSYGRYYDKTHSQFINTKSCSNM